MITAGMEVKIPDIGPMVQYLKVDGNEALLKLCGEEFWLPVTVLEQLSEDSEEE